MASKRALQYMAEFHAKKVGKTAVKTLSYYQYDNLEYIETNIRGQLSVQLFRDGAEEFTYWLNQKEREPLIIGMLRAGLRQAQIAKLLKLSSSTINKDVRHLRLYTDKLNNVKHLRPLKPARYVSTDDAFLTRVKRESSRVMGQPAAVVVLH